MNRSLAALSLVATLTCPMRARGEDLAAAGPSLQLEAASEPVVSPAPGPFAPLRSTVSTQSGTSGTSGTSSYLRGLGWTTAGLAGAAIVFGLGEGISANSKRQALIESGECDIDGIHCAPSTRDRVEAFRTARTLSIVGFVSGVGLALTSVVLFAVGSTPDSQRQVALLFGPTGVQLRGEL